ncbi:hypothetical protein ACFXJ8_11775 [Nonomuraea sp. NPDC059194]|uniref:hypothetical protein n=1 Tax=Nonomuraea sp. NPDC059194 TaxID=3346764 RepID=UPI00369B5CF2
MKNDKRQTGDAPAPKKRKLTAAEKLAAAAQAAADVRAYDTNPDVIAYRIERMRARVDRLIWAGLILGLLFTMVNVQAFAARGAEHGSTEWWAAWALDPTVSLVLLGVLLGEQVIARYQIAAGGWVRLTKWTALAFTYTMNTWESWVAGSPADILLHSVPPLLVFCAAEAVTELRHRITEAVHKAYEAAKARAAALAAVTPAATPTVTASVVTEEGAAAVTDFEDWAARRALKPLPAVIRRATPSVTTQPVTPTVATPPPAATPAAIVLATPAVTPVVTAAEVTEPVTEQVTDPGPELEDPASKTAIMRAHWEQEIAAKRYPSVSELKEVSGAHHSLASRRRREWVEELPWQQRRKAKTSREKVTA